MQPAVSVCLPTIPCWAYSGPLYFVNAVCSALQCITKDYGKISFRSTSAEKPKARNEDGRFMLGFVFLDIKR